MKRITLAVTLLVSAAVAAQEIGTEIQGPTSAASQPQAQPQPQTTSPNDNPYATPDAGQPQPAATTQQPKNTSGRNNRGGRKEKDKDPVVPLEAGVTAREGSFGIRGSFGVSGAPVPSGGTVTTLPGGAFGLSYWASDSLTLLFDVGGGFALVNSSAFWGVNLGIGLDVHFATAADPLRPFFHLGVLGNLYGLNSLDFGLTVNIGFGAEYFFAKNFSVIGRLNLSVPMAFPSGNFNLFVFTAAPAVGAAWYF